MLHSSYRPNLPSFSVRLPSVGAPMGSMAAKDRDPLTGAMHFFLPDSLLSLFGFLNKHYAKLGQIPKLIIYIIFLKVKEN